MSCQTYTGAPGGLRGCMSAHAQQSLPELAQRPCTLLLSKHHETCLCEVASPCICGGMSTPAAVAVAAKHGGLLQVVVQQLHGRECLSMLCYHSLHGISIHSCSRDRKNGVIDAHQRLLLSPPNMAACFRWVYSSCAPTGGGSRAPPFILLGDPPLLGEVQASASPMCSA